MGYAASAEDRHGKAIFRAKVPLTNERPSFPNPGSLRERRGYVVLCRSEATRMTILGHFDPPHVWSVGGERFRWFNSGAGFTECYMGSATFWIDLIP